MTNSIAELNIKLRADLDGLRQDLRVAERTLKNTANGLSALGRDLSTYVTLPLLGIGGAAVKAAGEFEALQLAMRATFEGAGRSMGEADAELENLRKSAMAPGLDLEQAVKASIRLQNVGFSAESARATIEELANAIATTGGTAEDLDEVTRQFGQMIAKGTVLQADLRIIQERMPIISRLMKETWKTNTAEGLRDAGVSASEFVSIMTTKMQGLPRVAGGISNSIVNATSAIRQFAVGIGEMLNKNLGLQGMLDGFSSWLGKLTERMKELSPEAKEFLAGLAKWAIIIPPIILGLAGLAQAQAAMSKASILASMAVKDFGKFIVNSFEGAIAYAARLRAAFLSLSLATQALAGVAIAGAVFLAIQAFQAYNKELSATEKAALAVSDVQRRATNSTANERYEAEKLLAVIRDKNAQRGEQVRALSKLQSISKQYFGDLTLETAATEKGTAAMNAYTAAIIGQATAKKAADRIAEINMQLADQKGLAKEAGLSIMDMTRVALSGAHAGLTAAKLRSDNTKSLTADLEAERTALEQLVDKNKQYVSTSNSAGIAAGGFAGETQELTKELKKARQEAELEGSKSFFKDFSLEAEKKKQAKQDELRAAKEILLTEQMLSAEYDRQDDAIQGILANQALMAQPVGAAPIGGGATNAAPATPEMDTPEKVDAWKDSILRLSEAFIEMGDAAVNAYSSALEAAKEGGITAKESHEAWRAGISALAKSAVQASSQIVGAYIRQGVAASVSKALASVPPPFNLALAAAAGAASEGLFKMLIARISVPKLAKGGLAYAPTMAMVGDNPNARANPEVIAPLSKLKDMLADSGGGAFAVSHRIEGNDLLLLVERANMKRTRARGF